MHHNHSGQGLKHLLIMVACCVIPMAVILAVFVFRVDLGSLGLFAVMLLCPLLHILMMKGMMGSHKPPVETAEQTQVKADSHG